MSPRSRLRRRTRPIAPSPASRAFYLRHAEDSLAAAAAAKDAVARALHEEECALWLMLARQREAIEGVLRRFLDEPEPVAAASQA